MDLTAAVAALRNEPALLTESVLLKEMTGGAKIPQFCNEIITGTLVQKLQVWHCLRVK